MLEELLGRSVEVSPCPPWAPITEPGAVALFVDDSLVVRAVGLCDLPFSAYAGAAIGLMPVDQAKEAVQEQAISQTIAENLYEILNIASALYNVEGQPHMKLHTVHHIGDAIPPEVIALGGVLGQRLDLTVTISGYGEGRLSFVGVG